MKQVYNGPSRIRIHFLRPLESLFFCLFASLRLLFSFLSLFSSHLELVPQLKKDGTPQTRTPSRFALFVKENFARIKKGNEAFSHQDVMRALSSEFAKLNT